MVRFLFMAMYRENFRDRVLAELLPPLEGDLATAILARRDSQALFATAVRGGLIPLFTRACQAVEAGQTDPAEIRRVLGFEIPGHGGES